MLAKLPPGLDAELKRLDRLLHREILRLRVTYELSLDEYRGLYISDEQVDRLVHERHDRSGDPAGGDDAGEGDPGLARPGEGPLARLAAAFGLSDFERDALLLALAPELDLKYETLLAYLNNDVTRKHPTVDLALRLFGREAEGGSGDGSLRAALQALAPLFEQGLLEALETGEHRSSLARPFVASPVVVAWVLGLPVEDGRLRPPVETIDFRPELGIAAGGLLDRLAPIVDGMEAGRLPRLVVFEVEDEDLVEGAGSAFASALGRSLLQWDAAGGAGGAGGREGEEVTTRLRLVARLRGAGVFAHAGTAVADASAGRSLGRALEALTSAGVPVGLAVPSGSGWRGTLRGLAFVAVGVEMPSSEERLACWSQELARARVDVPPSDRGEVAERFALSPRQIAAAARSVAFDSWRESGEAGPCDRGRLFQAAREESATDLGRLAQKVDGLFRWSDLVLPSPTLRRLEEIGHAIRRRELVYGGWGFRRRGGRQGGLMILFSGASGTGKTLSATVIARELGLDLFRIDLAGVVSKYIGETEKNLDRIFAAARRANAILFFDEADALLGKRSEVKDAHDRYANIEVSYLLQKVEDHDGAVILASNLAKNMDQAFSRRMHAVVEFPKPDAELRERLWRVTFPQEAPLARDADFAFLARQFETTGGEIKTIALDAAFLAARDGGEIGMGHLIEAVSRQMFKQGRPVGAGDFKHYHGLMRREGAGVAGSDAS